MTETIFVIITAILFFVFGRAAEGAIRDSGQPTPFNLDQAQKQGYLRARMRVDTSKTMTMDEMLLALHRQEGLLGAVNDNFNDLHLLAKKYGAEE